MQRGKLLVISGPSGVGKSTTIEGMRARHPDMYFSVSATTRQKREAPAILRILLSDQEALGLQAGDLPGHGALVDAELVTDPGLGDPGIFSDHMYHIELCRSDPLIP